MAGLRYLGGLNLSFRATFFFFLLRMVDHNISINLLPHKTVRRDTQKAFPPYLLSALYLSRPLRLIIECEV